MRNVFILCFTVVFLSLLIPVGITNAQDGEKKINITEVEKLLEEKLNNQKPLTREELTKVVLEMKDEKIANLEGNLTKVLNTAGLVVAVITLFLALVTGITGWLVKKNINEKLSKLEEKENEVIGTYNYIKTKSESIEEYFKQMKEFVDEQEKTRKKLERNESLLKKRDMQFDELRKYVIAVEDIANISILVNQFIKEKNEALVIIDKTRALLQKRQKNQDYVLLKLSQKLGMNDELTDQDSIRIHLENLVKGLNQEEDNIWQNIQIAESAEELYLNQDEDTTPLYEEIEFILEDWKGYLNDIVVIKKHWEDNLALNPIEEPS